MVKKLVDSVHGLECHDLGESSDSALQEEAEKREGKTMCQHVSKSVSLADIKRHLKAGKKIGACDKKVPTPCSQPNNNAQEVVPPARVPAGVWLCLQCGHQGCPAHATQHFNTPRSDSHALAVNVDAWGVWCFTCGEPVSLKSNKKLHEAVQFVRKRQGTLRPSDSPPKDATAGKPAHNQSSKNKHAADKDSGEVLPKVRGLINLGNTCYLNSVLQCISQCHYLAHYLDLASRAGRQVALREADGAALTLALPEGGPLTAALCDFLKQMHTVGTSAAISPSGVLSKISQKAAQFVGYDQQDAHELLRVLMENVRTEDLRRHQKQIMRVLNLATKVDPRQVDEGKRARAKALGSQVSHTVVDSIFGGQLISLVVCQVCKARTSRLEPFYDLSLPVAEDKPSRPRKLCSSGADVDGDDPAYVLSPKNKGVGAGAAAAAAGGKSRHAQKKERRNNRKATKANRSGKADTGAAGEAPGGPPSPDSGHEPDRPDPASELGSSDQGPNDADVEDNGDTELAIDSLLSELEHPASRAQHDDDPPSRPQSRLDRPAAGDDVSITSLVAATAAKLAKLSVTNEEVTSPVSPEGESFAGGGSDPERSVMENDEVRCNSAVNDGVKCGRGSEEERSVLPENVSECVVNQSRVCENDTGRTVDIANVHNVGMHGGDVEGNVDSLMAPVESHVGEGTGDGSVMRCNGEIPRKDCDKCEEEGEVTNDLSQVESQTRCNGDIDPSGENGQSNHASSADIPVKDSRAGCLESGRGDVLPVDCDSSARTETISNNIANGGNLTNNSAPTVSAAQSSASAPTTKPAPVPPRASTDLDTPSFYLSSTAAPTTEPAPVPPRASPDLDTPSFCLSSTAAPTTEPAPVPPRASPDLDTPSFYLSSTAAAAGEGGDGAALSRSEWLSRALTTLSARYQAAAGECSVLTCLNQYTAPELLTGNNKFGCEECTRLANSSGDSGTGDPPAKPKTVYSNASKQILVYSPPPVLTLQLKRFEVCAFSLRKVNRHVQFGETLDLAPFCSSVSQDLPQMRRGQKRVLYSLFGVVEHSGRLNSGHYTACVRVRRRHQQLTVNPQLLTQRIADAYQLACQAAADGGRADGSRADAAERTAGRVDEKQRGEEGGETPRGEEDPAPEPGRWFHVSDTHVTEVTVEKVLKSQAYLLFYERIL